MTTASLKQNEVVNHSLVCLGLAHIYLNQHEALHLWCELIKLTWLSPAWLLQLRKRRKPNQAHLSKWKGVLSHHKAHYITQHKSCLPRAPGKGVSLLPTATQNTSHSEHGGFQENQDSVQSASLQKPQGSVYKLISCNNLLFNTWNFLAQQICKIHLTFFFHLKIKKELANFSEAEEITLFALILQLFIV